MNLFEQVTILGVGLIGGSMALAMKARGLAKRIIGVGHREISIKKALDCGAIDRGTLSAAEGVLGSDLVVLATPIGFFLPLMQASAANIQSGAIIVDVGSAKQQVVADIEPVVPEGCHFVPCHPLAGSERRGIDVARGDLLDGAVCAVTPTKNTDAEALRRVIDLWQAIGMKVVEFDPAMHDRLIAGVSHLPHVVAAALVHAAAQGAEVLAATGFADTTRIASGASNLWCDILLANADAVVESIDAFSERLGEFAKAIRSNDTETLRTLLEGAAKRREEVVKRKKKTGR